MSAPPNPPTPNVLPGPAGSEPECPTCEAEGKQCIAGNGRPGHHGTYISAGNLIDGVWRWDCGFCGHVGAGTGHTPGAAK